MSSFLAVPKIMVSLKINGILDLMKYGIWNPQAISHLGTKQVKSCLPTLIETM